MGINAATIRDSAKSIRKRFGIKYAQVKASVSELIPKYPAIIWSRTRPDTLESSIAMTTNSVAPKILFLEISRSLLIYVYSLICFSNLWYPWIVLYTNK
jgi:hypothetical protein